MDKPAVLDEILRAKPPIQDRVLRRWQQDIRQQVFPVIDAATALLTVGTGRKVKES